MDDGERCQRHCAHLYPNEPTRRDICYCMCLGGYDCYGANANRRSSRLMSAPRSLPRPLQMSRPLTRYEHSETQNDPVRYPYVLRNDTQSRMGFRIQSTRGASSQPLNPGESARFNLSEPPAIINAYPIDGMQEWEERQTSQPGIYFVTDSSSAIQGPLPISSLNRSHLRLRGLMNYRRRAH